MPQFVFLWTDMFLWLIVVGSVIYAMHVLRRDNLRASWRRVFLAPAPMSVSIILACFVVVGLADSIHFRTKVDANAYSVRADSLLDIVLARQLASRETTYSAPLSYQSFLKETTEVDGRQVRDYPRLKFGGAHLANPGRDWRTDVIARASAGVLVGLLSGLTALVLCAAVVAQRRQSTLPTVWRDMLSGGGNVPWRT